jgi:hypothetical protein
MFPAAHFQPQPKDPVGNGIDLATLDCRPVGRLDPEFQYWKAFQPVEDGLTAPRGRSAHARRIGDRQNAVTLSSPAVASGSADD